MNYITHERLDKKFKSNFDLVNYAIKIAKIDMQDHEIKSLSQLVLELEDLPDIK